MRPLSTLSSYLEHAEIKQESPSEAKEMVLSILHNHKVLIESLREVINKASDAGDEGTIDMTGGFLASLEKKSWMLDAWLDQ